MSTIPESAPPHVMTAEAFFAWTETAADGERYELVDGRPTRLQSERASHNQRKASAWLAFRNALRVTALDCTAFTDGMSVRIDERIVREPDAMIDCGPYDGAVLFASDPVVVLEVISPSSAYTDVGRKLIDYFSVPSIRHYLIMYGDEERVVHHRRPAADGDILTRICARGDRLDLSPPGISVTVDALFDS